MIAPLLVLLLLMMMMPVAWRSARKATWGARAAEWETFGWERGGAAACLVCMRCRARSSPPPPVIACQAHDTPFGYPQTYTGTR